MILRRRAGLTIVEVLVTTAIAAVMFSLLSVAVLQGREAARRVTCASRLHQVGVASGNYVDRMNYFPNGVQEPRHSLSWFGHLLADMGHSQLQQEIYALDYTGPEVDLYWRAHSVPDFQCPSDLGSIDAWNASYAISQGSHFSEFYDAETYPETPYTGGMRYGRVRPADVTDGLTNTAYVAERVGALRSPREHRARWKTPYPIESSDELDRFADLCASMPYQGIEDPHSWEHGSLRTYLVYDHILTPNQPSCRNADLVESMSNYATSSEHPGGVNVLFADGAVHFISDSIDRVVWRAMGTRDGNDSFSWP